MTIFAMVVLKAFALDRKSILRAMVLLTLTNYIILKTTQDIRQPGDGFMRQAFSNALDKGNRRFILAEHIQEDDSQSSN
jgi:hypothetical protein